MLINYYKLKKLFIKLYVLNMVNIYYQGIPGAYMHQASIEVVKHLNVKPDNIIGVESFQQCRENLENGVLVLAIENSYAGSIHENLYNFTRNDAKIIGEYTLDINHCLCSKEKDIKDIKKAFSHYQALSQCYNYLKKHNIKPIIYSDTASAAKMVSESLEKGIASISSETACKMYGLNIIEKSIQDQKGNQTRFIVVVPKDSKITYSKKVGKVSILFEARNVPASLYKCLGAFATNSINLTKIESLPSTKGYFTYLFWIDFEGKLSDERVKNSLDELRFFATNINILGEY